MDSLEDEFIPIDSRYSISPKGIVKNCKTNTILKGHINKNGYLEVSLFGQTKKIHRLVAIHFLPNPNNLECIDHIDRNKLNNDVSNLRWCTIQQNNFNSKRKNSVCPYKGISYCKKNRKWKASITFNKEKIIIGYYDTASDSALAYNEKAKELFGEFAYLNTIFDIRSYI